MKDKVPDGFGGSKGAEVAAAVSGPPRRWLLTPAPTDGQALSRPLPISAVSVVSLPNGFEQLGKVIQGGATPDEGLVVSLPSHTPSMIVCCQERGSLSSIAAGLCLTAASRTAGE
jgi:hypothetical protein